MKGDKEKWRSRIWRLQKERESTSGDFERRREDLVNIQIEVLGWNTGGLYIYYEGWIGNGGVHVKV